MLPPARPPRRWPKVLAVLLVVLLVGTAVTWYWYDHVRPLSMQEVLEKDVWGPGTRDLEDRIANVTSFNTTYGPAIWLSLESNRPWPGCAFGDPSVTYRIGDTFRTTMHFRRFTYNGHDAVWAPEVACPFPALPLEFGILADSVSWVMGTLLINEAASDPGWTTYRIVTPNGDRFPADRVNASLRQAQFLDLGSPARNRIDSAAKWLVAEAVEYVRISGGYVGEPEIDVMDSLAGRSRNGTMRFVDADADGLVGDNDAIQIRMNATNDEYGTYLLQLGGGMRSRGGFAGVKSILNGPRGPYAITSFPGGPPWLQLVHISEQLDSGNVTSTIAVGQGASGATYPYSAYRFTLVMGNATPASGPVTESPVPLPGGVAIDYADRNGNGLPDTGDRFVISGLLNRTQTRLDLSYNGRVVQSIGWYAGYGHVGWRIPFISFTASSGPTHTIQTNVPAWHPELALNRTLVVSLWENSTQVLNHVPLTNGTIGTWTNGTLSFEDRDGNGFLSQDDAFHLTGQPAAPYRMTVSLLWDAYRFSVDVGP